MWVAVAFAVSTLAPAGGVEFFDGSWEKALEEAGKARKLLFADFYTDW